MKAEILADKTLYWFERFMNSPRLERVLWYFLCAVAGFFLGYLCFRFQITG